MRTPSARHWKTVPRGCSPSRSTSERCAARSTCGSGAPLNSTGFRRDECQLWATSGPTFLRHVRPLSGVKRTFNYLPHRCGRQICPTATLPLIGLAGFAARCFVILISALDCPNNVITSYSIHYTKLYEVSIDCPIISFRFFFRIFVAVLFVSKIIPCSSIK